MRRRLWITLTSLVVVIAGPGQAATAAPTSACVRYSCEDSTGCDPLCVCRFITQAGGTCGDP